MIKKITAVLLALSMALSLCSFEVFSVDTAGMDVAWELASPIEEIGSKTTETLFGTDHSKFIAAINTEGAVLEITVTNPSDRGMMTNIFADAGWSNAYVCAGKDQYPSKGTYTYTVTAAELMEQFSLTEISNMRLQFGVYGDESVKVSLDSAKVYVPASTGDEPDEPLETTLTLSANDYGVGSNWQGTYQIPIDGVSAWKTTIEEMLKTVGSLSVSFEVGSVTVDGEEYTDGVQFCGVMQTNDSTTGGWHDEVYTATTLKAGDKVDINFGNVGKILVNDDSASTVNPIINAMISSENYPITEAHDFKVTLKNIVITVFPPLDEDVDEDAEEIILPYVKFGENDGDYNHNGLVTLTPEDLGLSGDRVMAEDVVNANIDRIIVSFDFVDLKTPSGISLDPSDLLVPYVYNIQNGEGDDWSNSIWYSDWANVATVDENGHVTVDMRDLLEQLDGKAGEVQISWDPTVVPEYYSGVNDSLTLYVKNVTIEYFEPGAEIHKITAKGWKDVKYDATSTYAMQYYPGDEGYAYAYAETYDDASGEYLHIEFAEPLEYDVFATAYYTPVVEAPDPGLEAYLEAKGIDLEDWNVYGSSAGAYRVGEWGDFVNENGNYYSIADSISFYEANDIDLDDVYYAFSVAVPEELDTSAWKFGVHVRNFSDDSSDYQGIADDDGDWIIIFTLGEILKQNESVTEELIKLCPQIWMEEEDHKLDTDFVYDIKYTCAFPMPTTPAEPDDDEPTVSSHTFDNTPKQKSDGTGTYYGEQETGNQWWAQYKISDYIDADDKVATNSITFTCEESAFRIAYNDLNQKWNQDAVVSKEVDGVNVAVLDLSTITIEHDIHVIFTTGYEGDITLKWTVAPTASAAAISTLSLEPEARSTVTIPANCSEQAIARAGDTCLNIKIDPTRTVDFVHMTTATVDFADIENYEFPEIVSVKVYNAPSSSGKGSGKSNYPGYVVQLGEEYHGFFMGGFMITMPHTFVGDECTQCGYIRPTPAEDSAE